MSRDTPKLGVEGDLIPPPPAGDPYPINPPDVAKAILENETSPVGRLLARMDLADADAQPAPPLPLEEQITSGSNYDGLQDYHVRAQKLYTEAEAKIQDLERRLDGKALEVAKQELAPELEKKATQIYASRPGFGKQYLGRHKAQTAITGEVVAVSELFASMVNLWPPIYSLDFARALAEDGHPAWTYIRPVFERYRRRPPGYWRGLENHISQLLNSSPSRNSAEISRLAREEERGSRRKLRAQLRAVVELAE